MSLSQIHVKQGVALTGRNRTGPPCSVGRTTAQAPGGRQARTPAALQTTTTDISVQNNTGELGWPVITSFAACYIIVCASRIIILQHCMTHLF